MTHTAFRPGVVLMLAVVAALRIAAPGEAAQRTPNPSSGRAGSAEQGPAGSAPGSIVVDADAQDTRRELEELLNNRYPPGLARVLKLDPSLLANSGYLAPYPSLAAFLGKHPEVAHNPGFFLERFGGTIGVRTPEEARADARFGLLRDFVGGFAAFMVFLVVTGVLLWLIRLVIDSRRWNRLSKVQAEVHNKLLDRFGSNEELLAYIQTPVGRKFLEAAPIPLHDEPRSIGAPFSRILWSVQAGVVLAITGLGLLFVSGQFADEGHQFFMVIGVLALALGCGFIVSAAAAYALSRKLGLLDRSAVSDHV